jgi:heme-degrading monooxygenase HmoA
VIRVVYRWRVPADRQDEFLAWWHEGTLRIRSGFSGALGSTLCRPADDDGHLVAVARWRSEDDLRRFWADPGGTPFEGSVLVSAEIFSELDHLTVEG